MDPFEYAMQIEKEGESLYREFADQTQSKELSTLFTWLAESELKHYNIFKEMKENSFPVLKESKLLEEAINIFKKIKENREHISSGEFQTDVYKKVLSIEDKMFDFYSKKSEESVNPKEKEIFQKIALEEKRHKHIMENIVDFASNPEVWLKEDKFKQILDFYKL